MVKKSILSIVLALILACIVSMPAFAAWEDDRSRMIDEPETWNEDLEGYIFWDEVVGQQANWVTGMSGKGLDTGGHVRYHIRYSGEDIAPAKALTLSTWIYWRGVGLATADKMETESGGVVIFGASGESGHLKVVAKDDHQGGGLSFVGGKYDQDVFAVADKPLPDNEWAMVTVTMDGKNMSLYLNGKLVAKQPQTLVPADLGLNLFRVGSSFWGPPTLNAVLDDTSIWKRALTADEIAEMYTDTNKSAPPPATVAQTDPTTVATTSPTSNPVIKSSTAPVSSLVSTPAKEESDVSLPLLVGVIAAAALVVTAGGIAVFILIKKRKTQGGQDS